MKLYNNYGLLDKNFINYTYLESEFISIYIKLIPIFISLFGLLLSFFIYSNKNIFLNLINLIKYNKLIQQIWIFFNNKGFFDILYNTILADRIITMGIWTYMYGDQGILEYVGPQGIFNIFHRHDEYSIKLTSYYLSSIMGYSLVIITLIFIVF